LKSDVEDSDCTPRSAVGKITGFIDIRDVLSSFLKELDMEAIKDAKMLKRMRILEELGQDFALKSVSSLKSLGSDGSFYNSDEAKSTSVLEIITEGFLNAENKAQDEFGGTRKRHVVHRLALIDGEGHLCHVVSQSDMIKFIFDHLDEFGSVSNETAEALGFVRGQDHVVKVSPDCPAIDAMMLMEERDISAVAVTNAVGAIIGNFSISELRNIMSEHFGSLALPVGEFLALEHGTEYAGYAATKESQNAGASNIPLGTSPGSQPSGAGFKFAHDREMRQRKLSSPGHEVGQRLITCSPETPLSEILSTIVHNRLHRVYVCGDDMVPCGVITLTDLLRKLVSM
jgi:5'-AMP-activated protein kinase regulatory gamma subunit